jgi:hypothetical protein
MMSLAIRLYNNQQLKKFSDELINCENVYDFIREHNITYPEHLDSIDLKELAPMGTSLKILGARMGHHLLEELPYDPSTTLTSQEMEQVKAYCFNDLAITELLYRELEKRIELRYVISNKHRIDLRSKSDAQIAESIFRKAFGINRLTNELKPSVIYNPPSSLSFKTQSLKKVLAERTGLVIEIDENGKLKDKEGLTTSVTFNGLKFSFGFGGLHSVNKNNMHVGDDEYLLIDADVSSMYPSIITNLGLYPDAIGPAFVDYYRKIKDLRLELKKEGKKTESEVYKIILNGAYGKLGSMWSCLYAPQALVMTALSGQLYLLQLIETLAINSIEVVSANTDGITARVHRDKLVKYYDMCNEWQSLHNLNLEFQKVEKVFYRDVSNYFMQLEGGKIKTKGLFNNVNVGKHPDYQCVQHAIIAHVCDGVDIAESIANNNNINDYLKLCKIGKLAKNRVVDPKKPTLFEIVSYDRHGFYDSDYRYLGTIVRLAKLKKSGSVFKSSSAFKDGEGVTHIGDTNALTIDMIDKSWYVRKAQDTLKKYGLDSSSS